MAHVAQGLFILFIGAAALVLLSRAGRAIGHALYTRPLLLWSLTAIVVATILMLTGRWRRVDWGGMEYFFGVAIAAFTMLAVSCEGYRILKRLMDTRR